LWIRRHLSRHIASAGLWLTAQLASNETKDFALAKTQIVALNENLFKRFDHRRAQLLKLTTEYPNVMAMTSVLKAAAFVLGKGMKFDVALMPPDARSLSVDDFFVDPQGRHIDPLESVSQFKRAALEFVEAYYRIEKVDHGIPNYNQRVLTKLLRSMQTVTQTLKEFSHGA
jgi:hypothetical protein